MNRGRPEAADRGPAGQGRAECSHDTIRSDIWQGGALHCQHRPLVRRAGCPDIVCRAYFLIEARGTSDVTD